MSDFHKFSEIPSIYMIENIINLHQERKMRFMKRVKSRIYSTQELDKRKKAIFSTQDIEQILGILYDIEYSCAVTPQIRQTGNRLSGNAGTTYASLLA